MPPRHALPLLAILATAVLAGCATPAEEPAPQGQAHAGSGYADLLESPVRGLTPKEIEDLRKGAGAGLALPAELNGYPGPKHVLEFEDELELTPEQRARMQAMYDEMSLDARRVGEKVIDAYAALDRAFREGGLTPEELDALVADVAEAEAELRAVHLRTHLVTVQVLTHEQVTRYNELRGYGGVHGGAKGMDHGAMHG